MFDSNAFMILCNSLYPVFFFPCRLLQSMWNFVYFYSACYIMLLRMEMKDSFLGQGDENSMKQFIFTLYEVAVLQVVNNQINVYAERYMQPFDNCQFKCALYSWAIFPVPASHTLVGFKLELVYCHDVIQSYMLSSHEQQQMVTEQSTVSLLAIKKKEKGISNKQQESHMKQPSHCCSVGTTQQNLERNGLLKKEL